MTSFIGGIWYFIADDDFSFYPVWNPAGLFDIVDGNISPTWKVGHHWYGRRLAVVVAFEEWARDSSYYERLTAGDPAAVEIFRVYKAQLEAEHPPSPA